jgi:multiple sugar transport system permease protein
LVSRFTNTTVVSFAASLLAVGLGSMTGYGLSRFGYQFGRMKNADISFFFLSQLILPPVVLALPFLVLYKEVGLLDSHVGLILLYTLTVLPIVIWIMRDQFMSIPTELEEAAQVDGQGVWGAFGRIVLPIALPGMVAAFVLSLVLTWNEYFFAQLLTSTKAKTLPVMVASQTGSQGVNWWSMAAISMAMVLPLLIVGILLERFIIRGMSAGSVK